MEGTSNFYCFKKMKKIKQQTKKALTKILYSFVILIFLFQTAGIAFSFVGRTSAADKILSDTNQTSEKQDETDLLSVVDEPENVGSANDEEINGITQEDPSSEENSTAEDLAKEKANETEGVININPADEAVSQESPIDQKDLVVDSSETLNNESIDSEEVVSNTAETSLNKEENKTNDDSLDNSDDNDKKEKPSKDENKDETDNSAKNEENSETSQDETLPSSSPESTDSADNGRVVSDENGSLQNDPIATINALPDMINDFLTSPDGIAGFFGGQNQDGEVTADVVAEQKKEIWSVSGNKAKTNGPVKLDTAYVAPQNDHVSVTFTKLPENSGTLSIEEITLTPEQVVSLKALSDKAYDITSTMENGTFEYDLTLPRVGGEAANVSYIEKPADELNDVSSDEIKAFDKNKIDVSDEKVEVNSVDHFTIFYVSSGSASATTTLTITKPASVVSGNFLIAGITFNGGSNTTVTPPSGWTSIRKTTNGTDVGMETFRKVAGGSEPASYSWGISSSSTERASGGIIHYSGVDTGNPVDVSSGNTGNSSSIVASAVTTTLANDVVVAFFGIDDDASFGQPSGTTERYDASHTDTSGPAGAADDFTQASIGSTGNKTSAATQSNRWVAQQVALRTASGPHTITASSGSGGTVSPTGAVSVVNGANQTFTITPDAGYVVADVLVDSVSQGRMNSYTFTNVTVDHAISASFDGGWSAPTNSPYSSGLPGGTSADNAFSSDDSRTQFDNSGDQADYNNFGLSIPASASIEGIEVALEGNRDLASTRNFNVSLSWNNGGGFTSTTSASGWTAADKTVVAGGSASLWGRTWASGEFGDGNFRVRIQSTSGGSNIYLDQVQVKVHYSVPHTITASSGSGGTVSPTGAVSVANGSNQTFTIVPDTGYVVADVLVDSVSQGRMNSYTFTNVTVDHAISASFDGGWNAPTSYTNNNSVTNPGNAYASNDSYAVFNDQNDRVDYRDFDLNIPSGSTIDGIEVSGEANRPDPRTLDILLSWNGGSNFTASKNLGSYPVSDKTNIAGGVSDTWGRTWSAGDFSNGNFRLRADAVTSGPGDVIDLDQVQIKIHYSDTTKPTIALYGTSPMTLEVGDSYSEPGAVWTDNVDGTGDATVGGDTVDTSTVNIYTVTYNYTDSSGNAADEVTRTVNVVDTTKPTIEAHGDETAEATSSAGATVSYTSPATADNYDAPGTATCLPASGSTFPLGDTTVTCNATDSATNAATPTTFVVHMVDTTKPTLPTADPVAGDYLTHQLVTLSSTDSGSGLDKIYYTTDGTDPDDSSPEYSAPIEVGLDMTVKAIAYDNAGNASDVLEAVYGIAPVITEETSSSVSSSSTTITWLTDDPATSRVIYDIVSHPDISGSSAPDYGYANSTVEDENEVLSHSVAITGLSVGTTYYFRTVSHGSPEAVSSEQSFATAKSSSSDDDSGDDHQHDSKDKKLASGASIPGLSFVSANLPGGGESGSDTGENINSTKENLPAEPKPISIKTGENTPRSFGSFWWLWILILIFGAVGIYLIRKWASNK